MCGLGGRPEAAITRSADNSSRAMIDMQQFRLLSPAATRFLPDAAFSTGLSVTDEMRSRHESEIFSGRFTPGGASRGTPSTMAHDAESIFAGAFARELFSAAGRVTSYCSTNIVDPAGRPFVR